MYKVGQSTQIPQIPRWMLWLIAIIFFGMSPDVVASSTPKFSAAYSYFANGMVEQAEFHQPSSPHSQKRYRFTYGLDGRDQLLSASYQYWTGSTWTNNSAYSLATGYTDDGALTALTRYNATDNADLEYSYTSGTHRLNEVIDWYNQEIYEFTYDGNGNVNRLSSVIGSSDYQITSTSYDWRNLPLSMVVSGAGTHTWRYDHQGLRVYSSAGSTYWLRGALGEPVAMYAFDGSGVALEHWNLLGDGGEVIGRREGSTRYYYHTDHLGSTRTVVNASGTVSEVYDYMPFGELMDGRSTTADLTREKFTGQPWDPEVNLYTMHWRRYVPWFGVFTSVDALSADYPAWSPYAYALNNPVVYIDPTGMSIDFYRNFTSGEVVWLQNQTDETLFFANGLDGVSGAAMYVNIGTEYYDFGSETLYYQTMGQALSSLGSNAGGNQELRSLHSPRTLATGALEFAYPEAWVTGVAGLGRGVIKSLVARGSSQLSTRFVSTSKGLTDLKPTLNRISSGGKFPHRNDGSIFKNFEGLLPKQKSGFYREFVHSTPGIKGPGPMRIITGQNGRMWFTPDHYKTFVPIR